MQGLSPSNIRRTFAIGPYSGTRRVIEEGRSGASAYARLGHAGVEQSIFDAEARGPNAEAEYEVSWKPLRASASAKAELCSASAKAKLCSGSVSAGPVKVKGSVGDFSATASVGAKASVTCDAADLIETINNITRPGDAFVKDTYAGAGTYAGVNKDDLLPMPKAGVYARAGVGHARAQWSIFDAEAKGPNAVAGAEASLTSLSAFARAELASASASAGPLKVRAALAADTGVKVSLGSVQAEILGTGVRFGSAIGIKLFGTGIEFNLL